MVSLRTVTEEEARWAEEVDRAYEELVEPPEEVSRDLDATLSIGLENPFFEQMDVKIHLDNVLLLQRGGIPKGDERIGEEPTTSGSKTLKIEFQTETVEISFEGPAAIKPGSNHLHIQFWDEEYPPKLHLNEKMNNKSLGPLYRKVGELPRELNMVRRIGLNVRDADQQLGQEFDFTEDGILTPRYNLIKIWIDEEKVEPFNSTIRDFTVPIRHQATLTPGKHRVKIASPVLHKVIFDGDIIYNGVNLIELTVHTCKTSKDSCRITVKKGLEEIFEGSYKELEFTEKYSSKGKSLWRDTSESMGGN